METGCPQCGQSASSRFKTGVCSESQGLSFPRGKRRGHQGPLLLTPLVTPSAPFRVPLPSLSISLPCLSTPRVPLLPSLPSPSVLPIMSPSVPSCAPFSPPLSSSCVPLPVSPSGCLLHAPPPMSPLVAPAVPESGGGASFPNSINEPVKNYLFSLTFVYGGERDKLLVAPEGPGPGGWPW